MTNSFLCNDSLHRSAADVRDLQPETKNVLSLLGLLYDACTDKNKWTPFLEGLAEIFGSFAARIIYIDKNKNITFSAITGLPKSKLAIYSALTPRDPRAIQHLNEPWHPGLNKDTDPALVEEWKKGKVYTSQMVLSETDLHASEIYQHYLYDLDIEYSLGCSYTDENNSTIGLGVMRGRKDQPFTQSDCDLLQQLIPHLKRAVTIHSRLCQLDFERRTALQTLDNINMGLALVDQFQQVLFANSQARALLANQDGLALNEQSLQCTDSGIQQRLSEAVHMVIAKAAKGEIEAGRAIAIKRPSGGRDYSLLVSPVWGNLIQVETEAQHYPIAAVFMQDPEQTSHTQAGLLLELYNLTVAESRVLDLLVRGFSVKEQASELDIQANTIRTHLKNIYCKTRTNSQAELVTLVMDSPLWMGAHAFSLN